MGVSWGSAWFSVKNEKNSFGVILLSAYPDGSGDLKDGKEVVSYILPDIQGLTFCKHESLKAAKAAVKMERVTESVHETLRLTEILVINENLRDVALMKIKLGLSENPVCDKHAALLADDKVKSLKLEIKGIKAHWRSAVPEFIESDLKALVIQS